MNYDSAFHYVALTLVPGVGPVNAKTLISYCGSAVNIFQSKRQFLVKIPGIGDAIADAILDPEILHRAAAEMAFMEEHGIRCLTPPDTDYPQRLKHCVDAPVVLYYSGNADLNAEKIIGVVGTRNSTEYGKSICEQLIEDLKEENILVVSGLAYGIDIAAHKACVKKNVATVGVLAHGLDRIYPPGHKEIAKKMVMHGGLLTEFTSGNKPDKPNFPKRNRIVAGMIDALVVVETAENGGAIITALLADSYHKDVMAFPGNVFNEFSAGCNQLIKSNRASLITSANDLLDMMCWKKSDLKKPVQRSLFIELDEEEKIVYDILQNRSEIGIDELSMLTAFTPSTLASHLLNLEFQGLITALPGKRFQIKV